MQTFNFRYDRVILIGDTHSLEQTRKILKSLEDRGFHGHDLVFLGDGGELDVNITHEEFEDFNDILEKADNRLYYIRGNHSNPDVWKTDHKYSNLFLVKEGDVGFFPSGKSAQNGKSALFLGGGISVDRIKREKGYDYWPDEVTQDVDIIGQHDFVFSHDCPEEFNLSTNSLKKSYGWYVDNDEYLLEDAKNQRLMMSKLCKAADAKYIFSGHFHNNCVKTIDDVSYRCININELYEVYVENLYGRTN